MILFFSPTTLCNLPPHFNRKMPQCHEMTFSLLFLVFSQRVHSLTEYKLLHWLRTCLWMPLCEWAHTRMRAHVCDSFTALLPFVLSTSAHFVSWLRHSPPVAQIPFLSVFCPPFGFLLHLWPHYSGKTFLKTEEHYILSLYLSPVV